jgi:hypothetical protein
MQKLKIIESYRNGLNQRGIVICTYKLVEGGEADCIELEYSEEYPTFDIVQVK